MIRYALQCDLAHEFEAWFGSSSDYDESIDMENRSAQVLNTAENYEAFLRRYVV